MHTDELSKMKKTGLPFYAAAMLVLLTVLMLPGAARAQWATNGNDINNTNTGNVGIGTSAPTGRLQVQQIGNTGLYATIITSFGANEDTFIRGGSGSAVIHIGDLTATTSKLLLMENGGFVGIGTSAPGRLLEVSGASTGTIPYNASAATISIRNPDTTNSNTADLSFRTNDSAGTTTTAAKIVGIFTNRGTGSVVSGDIAFVTTNAGTGSEKMRVTSGGLVGIGTAVPNTPLEVKAASTNIRAYGTGTTGANTKFQTYLGDIANSPFAEMQMYAPTGAGSEYLRFNISNSSGTVFTDVLNISRSGSVGVGTSTPNYRLDVQGGQLNASGGLCIAGDCKTAWSQVGGGTSQWTTAGTNIYFNTGNVGVGTTNPTTAKLVVSGTAGAQGLDLSTTDQYANLRVIQNTNGSDKDIYLGFNSGAGSKLHLYSNSTSGSGETLTVSGGSVGIGTASPVAGLDVQTPVTATTANGVRLQQTLSPVINNGVLNGLYINPTFSDGMAVGNVHNALATGAGNIGFGTTATGAGLDVQNTGVGVGGASYGARFQQSIPASGNNSISTAVYINPTFSDGMAVGVNHNGLVVVSGNVGIGTATPQKTLDVNGDMNASGTITGGNIVAKYQDVAEWVPSEQKLQAGTVVVLDSDRTNHVLASTSSYDTKVAGVISARPGIALGEGGEGKALVATTGRVKVKVDATRAPIKVGDLLVTSDVEGVAMKSVPVDLGGTPIHRPGTIIGKALEPLEKGTGEILVLLSLQ